MAGTLGGALFRRPIPRRAFVAAALGALYSFLLLPTPGPVAVLGVNLGGVAWFLLAMGLLFLRPFAYYSYVTWGLLWAVWKSVLAWQAGPGWYAHLPDVALPAVSVILLSSSGYVEAAHAARGEDDGEPA